ncbi:TatD family hydrolase [Marinimicrobium agarilyticum]|uniref:TatD family hydrolase n=1 Tax=Marinimicrobium agarilyticum TaxID=306546 RepID=UPI000401DCAE|nr:TatD family hydrolase [Marinimicrobium agarilyticum]
MPPELIDSHCHFDFEAFDEDREDIWSRCRSAGVRQLLIPGTEPEQWARAQGLCEAMPDWYFAAGIHPWWQYKVRGKEWLDACRRALSHSHCLAVGECGLDKFIDTPMAEQEALLEQHLQLAYEQRLPIVLHCVKAHNELIRWLKRYPLERGGVIHAFSGSVDIAETYWQMGFRLGVGGTITYERAKKTREAVSRIPAEALLLETDAPDMPLCGRQGERNSPEYLPDVARGLAELRGVTIEEIAAITTANAQLLFGFQH